MTYTFPDAVTITGVREHTGAEVMEACIGVDPILDVRVRDDADVTFRAGTLLEFANGFRVYEGGVFTAHLTLPTPCAP